MTLRQLTGFTLLAIGLATPAAHAQPPQPDRPPIATPTTKNAYDYFVAATEALDTSIHSADPGYDGGTPTKDLAPYHTALERNQAVLKANAWALELLRLGFPFPYIKTPQAILMRLHRYADKRRLARLLMLQADVDSQTGGWANAATCGIDAIQLGVDTGRGDSLDMLSGVAVESLGRGILRGVIARLNATDAGADARRLATVEGNRIAYADIIEKERDFTLKEMEEADARHPGQWQKQSEGSKSLAEFEAQYRKVMDIAVANASLPYSRQKPKPVPPTDPLARVACSYYTDDLPFGNDIFRFRYEDVRAANRLILTQLALQSYRAATGHFPDTLAQLVPNQLAKIPADPFALDAPLHYKKQGATYLLYSVGPDGIDDGGRPVEDKSAKNKLAQFDVSPYSHGDIVAGVNTH